MQDIRSKKENQRKQVRREQIQKIFQLFRLKYFGYKSNNNPQTSSSQQQQSNNSDCDNNNYDGNNNFKIMNLLIQQKTGQCDIDQTFNYKYCSMEDFLSANCQDQQERQYICKALECQLKLYFKALQTLARQQKNQQTLAENNDCLNVLNQQNMRQIQQNNIMQQQKKQYLLSNYYLILNQLYRLIQFSSIKSSKTILLKMLSIFIENTHNILKINPNFVNYYYPIQQAPQENASQQSIAPQIQSLKLLLRQALLLSTLNGVISKVEEEHTRHKQKDIQSIFQKLLKLLEKYVEFVQCSSTLFTSGIIMNIINSLYIFDFKIFIRRHNQNKFNHSVFKKFVFQLFIHDFLVYMFEILQTADQEDDIIQTNKQLYFNYFVSLSIKLKQNKKNIEGLFHNIQTKKQQYFQIQSVLLYQNIQSSQQDEETKQEQVKMVKMQLDQSIALLQRQCLNMIEKYLFFGQYLVSRNNNSEEDISQIVVQIMNKERYYSLDNVFIKCLKDQQIQIKQLKYI